MATGLPLNTTGLTPDTKPNKRIADLESIPQGLARQGQWRAPFYQQETDLTYQAAPEEVADILSSQPKVIWYCGVPMARSRSATCWSSVCGV
jgi:hypothetical protein